MAKNYVQPGKVITVTAPATVVSGQGVKVGTFFGVAQADAASGAEVEIEIEGVYTLPKDTNLVITQGDLLYWDAANAWLDKTASGSPTPQRVGKAVVSAAQTATTVTVLLTPCAMI